MPSNVTYSTNMKLILFTASIFVFGCSARPLSSVDQFQQIQQEVEQLKRSNEESVAVIGELKQTYDEKIQTNDEKIQTYDEKLRRYDDKIASLEQQLSSGRTLVPQSGTVSFSVLYLYLSDTFSEY